MRKALDVTDIGDYGQRKVAPKFAQIPKREDDVLAIICRPPAGDYTFSLNTSNRNNPSLTITSFLGAGFNQDGIGMPAVYLKGDFNMFGLNNVMTAAAGGRLYFATVNLTAGTYGSRFESADGVTDAGLNL